MVERGNKLCDTPEVAKAGRSDSDAIDMLDKYLSDVNLIFSSRRGKQKVVWKILCWPARVKSCENSYR